MSTPVPEQLPAGYTFGFVAARVIHVVPDSAGDVDVLPEVKPGQGSVTFTPATKGTRAVTAGDTAFVIHDTVVAPLDVRGRIRDANGNPFLGLVTGIYDVEFRLTSGKVDGFRIEVTDAYPSTGPLDLVTVAPYVPPTGVVVQTLVVPTTGTAGQVLARSGSGSLVWVDPPVGGEGGGGPTAWSAVTGKPSSFPPDPHTHLASQVSDATAVGRDVLTASSATAARAAIGAGTSSLQLGTGATTAKRGDYTPAWGDVTGKPGTFPPASHQHPTSDVDGLEGRLSALESAPPTEGEAATWSSLQGKPSTFPPEAHQHPWGDVTGKPATYPSATHGHAVSDVSGLQAALDGKQAAGSYQPAGSYASLADVSTASTADRSRANHTGTQPVSTVTGAVAGLNGVTGVWKGTQAQYDAITTKDDTVLYAVVAG